LIFIDKRATGAIPGISYYILQGLGQAISILVLSTGKQGYKENKEQ